MNIHEKHAAYTKLKTAKREVIERDIALLKIKNPQSTALQVSAIDIPRKGQEVLWDLLDVVSVEEIEKSRLAEEKKINALTFRKPPPPPEKDIQAEEVKKKASEKSTQEFLGRIMNRNAFKKR